jgi:Flp pilus assembly protein protease CpaA
MVATALLLVLLVIATVTDLRRRKIYNWTVYPGILAAVGLNAVGTVIEHHQIESEASDGQPSGTQPVASELRRDWGYIGAQESLVGFAVCGGLMLVVFVFFPGVGGGDVKLLAMTGAFLGLERGLEVLLWTFLLAACLGLTILIWRVGALVLIGRVWRQAMFALRIGGWAALEPAEREQLQFPTSLAHMTLAAVLVVELVPREFFGAAAP